MSLQNLTIIYPYYDNPTMLKIHLDNWKSYGEDLKAVLKIIIVDDHSRNFPAFPILCQEDPFIDLTLYWINDDIEWNQHGARNLAAQKCQTPFMLMTDMDNLFEESELRRIMALKWRNDHYYTFERIKMPERENYRYHCNTFLVKTDNFWLAGGYDEDYCGTYGGDGHLHRAMDKISPREHTRIKHLWYPRGYLADAGTSEWDRKGSHRDAYLAKRTEKKRTGLTEPTNPIRFTYDEKLVWRMQG